MVISYDNKVQITTKNCISETVIITVRQKGASTDYY